MNFPLKARLGGYERGELLGSGAMGEVYRARDLRLERDVAMKLLRPELASDPERLLRFEREARAASALNHPNLVHIYDIGREGDTPYIVMELVEGKTLRQLAPKAPPALVTIIERLLAKEPGIRFPATRNAATDLSMAELIQQIESPLGD